MAPAPSALRPALFFDRDGVVNQSPGPGYVNHLDDFHLLPGFADCDGDQANGCEVNLFTDAFNCGSCGTSCPGLSNYYFLCKNQKIWNL